MDQDNKNNEGIDLNGAFKGSGTDVKFEEEYRALRSYYPQTPKMIQWVMKYSGGLVKDKKQANYVLMGLVIIAFAVSFFFFFIFGKYAPATDNIPLDDPVYLDMVR